MIPLAYAWLEDRQGMSAAELDELANGLEADPRLAHWMRSQISSDDWLSLALDPSRNDFAGRVRTAITAPRTAERFIARVLRRTSRRGDRAWRWYLSAAAAGFAAFMSWWWYPAAVPGIHLEDRQGDVLVERGGLRVDGSQLVADDALTIAAGGGASIVWGDGTRVRLAGPARARLGIGGRSSSLKLDVGTADASVRHHPHGSPFSIATPHALATDVGTVFQVHATAASTAVVVREGRVGVTDAGGRAVEVGAGERCIV
ncbi:MAG: FecR domain-containing protein, partial [Planctomycetes bacterium]|nr:FecR domain-containing protein [Planctomycetota bacterium]